MGRLLNIKRFLPLLALLLGVAALSLGAPKLSRADSFREELGEFHHFLHEHPRVADDLRRDPWLANNRRYLHEHDSLRDFLHNHPQVRREMTVNPGRVMAGAYGWNSGRYENYRRYDDRSYGYYPPYNRPWWRR